MIGRTLAHYKILEEIGSGGMGVVYRAEDTKLGRQVALKVLPAAFLEDEERRSRFGREARILASLNHPNIAALHSLEQEGGVDFLVLELVEGETLAERIARGPLRLEEALALFRQIAEALEAAHGKGVVHRDLKPSNIKIAPGGKVKVLDFGLAKASMPDSSSGDLSQSPTISRHVTESGVILGTAAYMSPEQARGDGVDKRTDIWAFGCCLVEALSGKPPFLGRTVSDTIAKILETEPDWARLPPSLRTLLKRCLRKDLDRRIHDIADVRIELEEIGDSDTPVAVRRRWLPYVVTALAAGAVAALGIWNVKRTESPGAERALQVTSAIGVESYPTWSPDGGRLAYESNQTGNWDIWVTQLGGGEPVNLTGDPSSADRFPSWSPDGQQIAYLSEKDRTWSLHTLSALGGRSRKLLSLPSTVFPPWGSAQWSQEGSELAVALRDSGGNFVEIVSLESREARQISLPGHDEDAPHDLSWSPDGGYFAYVAAIQLNAEVTRLWILPSSGGEAVPVTDGYTNVWHPSWSSDGRRLTFVSNLGGSMDLWEQRIGEGGMPQGEPERVTTGLEVRTAAFSPDGTRLAYSRGRREYDSNIWRVRILHDRLATWADAEQLTFDNAFIQTFEVSPDGRRLVFASDRAGNQDLWILPSEGGEMTQLTTHPTPDWNPRWSPDGEQIAFYAYRTGNREIWVMPSEGGPARQLTFHPAFDLSPTWSPDGQRIAFTSRRSGNDDIWVVDAQGGEPQQVTTDPEDDHAPEWSPDGRWLGFTQFPAGRFLALEGASLDGEPRILVEGPAQAHRWSRDGKFIFYTGDGEKAGNLWAASLESRKERRLTDFFGRRGRLGFYLATDGEYLYFHWDEDVADLWVMDVNK